MFRRDSVDVGAERRAGQSAGHLQRVQLLHCGAWTQHTGTHTHICMNTHTRTNTHTCTNTHTPVTPCFTIKHFSPISSSYVALIFLLDPRCPSFPSSLLHAFHLSLFPSLSPFIPRLLFSLSFCSSPPSCFIHVLSFAAETSSSTETVSICN